MIAAPDIEWESVPCEICGTVTSETIFTGPDRLEHQPGKFTLVRCNTCGTYRQNPRPVWSTLEKYYTEDYASHPKLVRDENSRLRRLDKRYGPWKRRRALERFVKGGKLLEIGCGTGLFLEEIIRYPYWQASGVEPSDRASAYAQEKLSIKIHTGRIEDVDLPTESYDVIVMWNVVEHLAYPVRDLKNIISLIKPGGWLVFSVPNIESIEARLFGRYWVGWDLPRHLYIFPQQALNKILHNLGLQIEGVDNVSTGYSLLGHSLDFWSQDWDSQILRKFILRAYYNPFARLATAPFLWLLDRTNNSTLLTYFAQKLIQEN